MGTTHGAAALRPNERIRRRQDFQRVHERGHRMAGRYMTALFLPNALGHGRLGIIASRRLGGAVQRNRAKRLIREIFRLNKTARRGWDLVIIPKTDLLDADFAAIEADFHTICQRHSRRTRP